MRFIYTVLFLSIALGSCKSPETSIVPQVDKSFSWNNAIVYFLMTDRFVNGSVHNDFIAPADAPPAPYRGFLGGDLIGVTKRLESGYFNQLGVNAIWTTPLLENIKGSVDEGTGTSYAFHGYWTRDWTNFDDRVASEQSFAAFVKTAHEKDIRVIMDVIINHTGPVTPMDSQWPDEWVRTSPKCEFQDYKSTVECTLVKNLPDIKTESLEEVDLPPFLIAKWKEEGRYEKEMEELDAFFERTGYPKRPFYYIIKWLTDYVREYGIDGFRVDTAKHLEEEVWKILTKEAQIAFDDWKKNHPEEVLDDTEFYMVGEVYNYFVGAGKSFDFGDKKVDYFDYGFDALINFDFKGDANKSYEELFQKYDTIMNDQMKGYSILNYISSHDDGSPFDLNRERTYESATKLLLTQGGVQIYYGDESARSLTVEAQGDARLRSFMNWDSFEEDETLLLLQHWKRLGKFRNDHKAIAMGKHQKISDQPYTFSRVYENDKIIAALDLSEGQEYKIDVGGVFKEGEVLLDRYSDMEVVVRDGKVVMNAEAPIVLLEQKQ